MKTSPPKTDWTTCSSVQHNKGRGHVDTGAPTSQDEKCPTNAGGTRQTIGTSLGDSEAGENIILLMQRGPSSTGGYGPYIKAERKSTSTWAYHAKKKNGRREGERWDQSQNG